MLNTNLSLVKSLISPLVSITFPDNLAFSKILSGFDSSKENPMTLAPSKVSQILSHDPLNPVCPVINTVFPYQNFLSSLILDATDISLI